MTRQPILAALGIAATLALAACSGGAATGAPTTAATGAPASQPAASEPVAACAPSSDAGTVAVAIKDFAFSPAAIAAKVGDVVAFTNQDGAPHTATLDDDGCGTGNIASEGSAGLVFSAPGSYPFHCAIHPTMTGTVEVSN